MYNNLTRISVHWWWGRSITLIERNGIASVELQLEYDCPSTAFVKGLIVEESQRRKNIGRMLMETCEKIAIKNNKSFMQLDVDKSGDNFDWLCEWYSRMGYILHRKDEHYVTMVKVLRTK